jgi:peptidoglycan/LPS O-acetylase OafA/YrhL
LVVVSTVYTFVFHRATNLTRDLLVDASVLFYEANWMSIVDTSGWFGGMPHTWSLAVEVQFYVLWAIIIALAAHCYATPEKRIKLLNTLTVTAIGIAVSSAVWRAALCSQHVTWLRTYLGTDTRLDALFIGATVALLRLRLLHVPTKTAAAPLGFKTIALIQIVSAFALCVLLTQEHFRKATFGMAGFSIVGLSVGTLILTCIQAPNSLFGIIFQLGFLRWVGRISYSIYIWHVPAEKLFSVERLQGLGIRLPTFINESLRVTFALLLGLASYHLIELTFLRFKKHFERQSPAEMSPANAKPVGT